jgi:hypothetical protein
LHGVEYTLVHTGYLAALDLHIAEEFLTGDKL